MIQVLKKAPYWIPAIAYMALIFCLSSFPSPEITRSFPIYLKLKMIHMIEYGILYYLYRFAIIKTTRVSAAEAVIMCLSMTFLYGLTDEFHQVFVPTRSASLMDATANLVGALMVQGGIYVRSGRRR